MNQTAKKPAAKALKAPHIQVTAQPILNIPATLKPPRFKRPNFKLHWEWVLCFAVLVMAGSSIFGYDVVGLSGPFTAMVALGAGLVASVLAIITAFIMSALVVPLLALVAAVATAFIGLFTLLLGLLVSAIIMPLAALFTGLVATLTTWLAGTWLGTLLLPVYNVLAPIVLKISPWITTGKYAGTAWNRFSQNEPLQPAAQHAATVQPTAPAQTMPARTPHSTAFSAAFLLVSLITIVLFAVTSFWQTENTHLKLTATFTGGISLLMLAVVLYRVHWSGNVPRWLYALLPLLAGLLALYGGYQRYMALNLGV